VLVTTNLSINIANNPIYNELRTWPRVDWQISFDNADKDKFEYVRDGANWEVFVSNIQLMKQHKQHVIAHPAYSIYCAFDLVEYYEFCVAEDLDLYWCELVHPWDLDIRRYSEVTRQQAVAEIDRVIERFGHKFNLAIDTLKGYQKTLKNNSYLTNQNYRPNPSRFHQQIEATLNKKIKFEQLWSTLIQQDNNE
jgi:hypothetical protein